MKWATWPAVLFSAAAKCCQRRWQKAAVCGCLGGAANDECEGAGACLAVLDAGFGGAEEGEAPLAVALCFGWQPQPKELQVEA